MKHLIAIAGCALFVAGCASTSEPQGPSATARLQSKSGSQVSGTIRFVQVGNRVRVTGEVTGHTGGSKGFHLHEKGDCSSADGMSAGGHFNPAKAKHGAPGAGHAGDLGNLVFDQSGRASVNMMVDGITVSRDAANGIIGRAVIVHASEDDLKTDPTGNAGGRVACGVIE
jgi:Cu-Zn family superoxide dismutase